MYSDPMRVNEVDGLLSAHEEGASITGTRMS